MSITPVCPQCGEPLPGDGPAGQCPACLFKAALLQRSSAETTASVPSVPDAGTRLKYFGDYELLEEIARGGMGVVWKARQTNLNREVALKMIRAGTLASSIEIDRFLREAEAAANLQHPNIVAIHEVGQHGGQHYFSMDYVAGRDLGAIAKDGPLPAQQAARYVQIIAEAIHFAHQRGTLHRDLKPQNVLIDSNDQPRITDFGLAKIMKEDSRMTQTGVIMGSPSYMPPEQAAGRNADVGPASDVYSLGALLYELLTGRPPFLGSSAAATMRDVLESEPASPRRLKADIPPDLETICLKCLEKTPSARYPSARELAEELDRFRKGEPIQAKPAGTLRKCVSWARRHPKTLASLAAVVIVVLAFGSFYLWEENAFLRAKQADPALVKDRGPHYESLQVWSGIGNFLPTGCIYIVLFQILLATRGQGKELSFKERLRKGAKKLWHEPLGYWTKLFAVLLGLGLLACGVMILVTAIRANVWEGEPLKLLSRLIQIYALAYFGFALLWWVVRDYRRMHFGLPLSPTAPAGRQLTPEQTARVGAALEGHDWEAAIDRYLEAVPGTQRREANNYVAGLFLQLHAEHPERFAPPPLSLATLNGRAMLTCALFEGVILVAAWLLAPPTSPSFTVLQFGYAFLLGLGIVAGMRVKAVWGKLLLLVPALAAMAIGEALLPGRPGTGSYAIGLYLWGTCFGMVLMVAGFSPRRKVG